jgi:hypothetical protein
MSSTTPRHREVAARTNRLPLLVVALLVVVAALAMTGSSSASYVSTSGSTGTVSAAADWTPPTVAVTTPGSALKGTATITATASDADSGIANVTIQSAPAGGSTWTTLCTTTASPYTCSWTTTGVADGAYDLRALAVDRAGNSTTSATVRATVANALTVVLARPGDVVRGTVSTSTTVSNAGTVSPTVRVEYAPAGTTSWTTLCTAASAPYTCSASTTSIANGTYDLRSVAVAGSTTYSSAVVANVVIDNLAPTVTMTDPGSPLKGTKTFAATASDAHSGIAKVVIQASTGTTWTDLCTVTASPYSCSVDTSTLANGTYSVRAVATDRAGNTTTSAVVANRVVQNTVSSVTLTPPAAYLKGTVTLAATATSNGTIASVRIQRSVAGANSWTDICTDTTSPYSCSFATTQVADGTYDLRAVVTDADGVTTPSSVVTNRVVDNTPGKGVDVQTTNGGTAGRIDAGDTMVFTFSEQMDLSSIYSGWSGAATSGSVQVRDGLFVNGSIDSDLLSLSRPTGADLGTVNLNANFATVFSLSSNVTMTAATVTQDGVARTVVTLRVDGAATGNQVTTPATMVWTPAATILDLAGNAIGTAAVNETGPVDVDF